MGFKHPFLWCAAALHPFTHPAEAKEWAASEILTLTLWSLYQTTSLSLILGAGTLGQSPGLPHAVNSHAGKKRVPKWLMLEPHLLDADLPGGSILSPHVLRSSLPYHRMREQTWSSWVLFMLPLTSLDLSLSATWKYSMMWKEKSRDVPLSKGKMECKLSDLDH